MTPLDLGSEFQLLFAVSAPLSARLTLTWDAADRWAPSQQISHPIGTFIWLGPFGVTFSNSWQALLLPETWLCLCDWAPRGPWHLLPHPGMSGLAVSQRLCPSCSSLPGHPLPLGAGNGSPSACSLIHWRILKKTDRRRVYSLFWLFIKTV